ncbi:MAG: hypothetical protein HOW73_00480 [Polyangiaceae bacterium]|nr:hypothetical protein [Polyangiaceae bacterium]
MRAHGLLPILLSACLHCTSAAHVNSDEPTVDKTQAPQSASTTVAAFRAANRPRIIDDIPGETVLGDQEREAWCGRLLQLAKEHLARPGDRMTEVGPCAVTLVPSAVRQVVPDVRIRFDVGFFFQKPYAAASYDRETRTLYLPLSALETHWDEAPATRHEWFHARIHERARAGDPLSAALETVIASAQYRPDAFHVDEVPANLCDIVQVLEAGGRPRAQQVEMARSYLEMLRTELRAMKGPSGGEPETRAGVSGIRLPASDNTVRWVGGADVARTVALLEDMSNGATGALDRVAATPPDVEGARARAPFCAP